MARFWQSQQLAGRLRAIGPTLVGYVFLINFIGVIFEVGNETLEKIWSDFAAEQK